MKSLLPRLLHLVVRLSLGLLVLAGLCLALGVQVRTAHAQSTFNVTDCTSDSQLQGYVTQANTENAGDIITFGCGGDIKLTQTLHITGNMTIDGSGQNVVLDGQNQYEVFFVGITPVIFNLQSITVANGLYPDGGGLANFGDIVNISNSTFQNNSACDNGNDYGGAIYSAAHTTITNSTFIGNSASFGGAISTNSGSTMSISNSTFSGNTAGACNGAGEGGAIEDETSTTSITNSTIVGNTAPTGKGGGLDYGGGGGSIQPKGSIVANNTGGNCGSLGNVFDQGYNLESATDCNFTNTGSLQNTDPKLDPSGLQNNGGPTQTIALLDGSPAIDQVASGCPSTDQRGMTRPDASYETNCDMGAYESSYAPTDTDLDLTNMPSPITTSATSSSGAVVNYTLPTVVDEDNPLPPVTCSPATGSTFPVGVTTVTCTVTDSDDTPSTVSKTFTVTVTDTDLALKKHANITVNATSPNGAVVSYNSPIAVDEDSPLPPVTCSPTSGSIFAIGTTTVNCSVSDSDDSPNSASQSFSVIVKPVLTLTVPATFKPTEGFVLSRVLATGKAYGTSNPLTATINWGDGSSPTVLNNITPAADGSYSVSSSHTYVEEGQYTLTITVQDGGTLSAMKTSTVTVADAALKLRSISTGISGKTLTLRGAFSDNDPGAALADYTTSISWGDGTPNTSATLSNTTTANVFNYLAQHSYAAHGTYTVTITFTDAGGSTLTTTTTVTV